MIGETGGILVDFANSPEIRIDSCLLWHPRKELLTCVAKAAAEMLSFVLETV